MLRRYGSIPGMVEERMRFVRLGGIANGDPAMLIHHPGKLLAGRVRP
jgi:hypothetical protein